MDVFSTGHLANATTDLMKLDHEEEPQFSEPYLSKQKKLMVRTGRAAWRSCCEGRRGLESAHSGETVGSSSRLPPSSLLAPGLEPRYYIVLEDGVSEVPRGFSEDKLMSNDRKKKRAHLSGPRENFGA